MNQVKNYDSSFCGSLPIHLINLIQPYGLLLVLQKSDFKIIQVSENIESMTGLAASDATGTFLADYLPTVQWQLFQQKIATIGSGKVPIRLTFTYKSKTFFFLALIHIKEELLILELEETGKGESEQLFTDVFHEIKFAVEAINRAQDVQEICETAISELKRISGFDKIMLYKFDEHWNGEVIAEVMEPGMESYLGQHFPASDIPKQARELYRKNAYRLIPTRDYLPVKLYPVVNPVTDSFLDLGDCNIRSVAAVHIEYLKNMRVMASMSTAILKDGQLWGLIACHHTSEKFLNYEKCSVFEMMANYISNRISALIHAEQLQTRTQLQHMQSKLVEQIYLDDDLISALLDHDIKITSLLRCSGAVVLYNKKMMTTGNVPQRHEIKELVMWLQAKEISQVYINTNLSADFENAAAYPNIASGIIVLPIHLQKGEMVIGFRPEVVQSISWGGNPNEAIQFEKGSTKYHPRASFKEWKQIFQNCSLPFIPEEEIAAETIRNFLIEYTLKKVYATM